MKGIIMMKRQKSTLLAGLMIASLMCSNATAKAGNSDGFVTGLCAAGAALLGVAGAVALADWCFSETDDQMIARIDAQCRDIVASYQDDMMYLNRLMRTYDTSESTLHEFATYVWNKNVTQRDYRSGVWTTKGNLDSSVKTLRKRVNKLASKRLKHEDQEVLRRMRQLLNHAEELLTSVGRFVDVLESHKTYFDLYDAIDSVRSKYFQEINILESRSFTTETEIKRSILNRDHGQYAFRTFVIRIKSDISDLESKIRFLKHGYDAKRQYAQLLLNYMITIKNIVVNDPRYQQELYEWEQAELQRQRIEIEKARARAEQDRAWAERNRAWAEQRKADAMREQNRIAAERNRIEKDRLWQERQQCNDTVDVNVNIEFVI
jgi:hypothetical protein